MSRARTVLLLGALLAGAALLGGCGKKGDLRPLPGEYEAFTWPQQYPAPSTVVPTPPEQEERVTGDAGATVTRGFRRPDGLPARDPSRTTTTIYGTQ